MRDKLPEVGGMHKFGGEARGDNNFPERARGKIKTAWARSPEGENNAWENGRLLGEGRWGGTRCGS